MSDGTQQGIGADRALKTVLGGETPPAKEEERTPEFWLERLRAKDDDINGYDAHAEVMAKYIVQAYEQKPELRDAPISSTYKEPIDWENPEILVHDLSDRLKAEMYQDPTHPFRRALAEATGFTWGWAFNIARYAMGLPPQPNPAIFTVGG